MEWRLSVSSFYSLEIPKTYASNFYSLAQAYFIHSCAFLKLMRMISVTEQLSAQFEVLFNTHLALLSLR
jgi:hypothetical protein